MSDVMIDIAVRKEIYWNTPAPGSQVFLNIERDRTAYVFILRQPALKISDTTCLSLK